MQYIDRWGVQGVLGRHLYAREVYRLSTVQNILTAYQTSEQAANIATWAEENPKLASLLTEARNLAKEIYPDV